MSCARFENEGLLALERGEALDAHFDSCPDCLAARALYQRLGAALAGLHAEAEPPVGWQARVRQRVAERSERRRPRWWWWLALPAAAAAGLLLVLVARDQSKPARVALRVEVRAGEVLRRGTDAHPGDRLEISAETGGAAQAELRIYRNDQGPLLACSTALPCRRQGDTLTTSFELPSIGSYQVVLLVSPRPLPRAQTGTLDGDAGQALEAGAEVELGREIAAR